MLVKEVAALAAALMGREDLVTSTANAGSTVTGELNLLLKCYNLVENEIALDYFPLTIEEVFTPLNGRIYFGALTFTPVDIYRVTVGGVPVKFELYASYLSVPKELNGSEVKVKYSYSPPQKNYTESSEYEGKVSPRLMAFGMACEFCLAHGRYDEAATWEGKFRDALRAAGILRRTLSMRSRRWA